MSASNTGSQESADGSGDVRTITHKLAEWISLTISALIICTLASFLVVEALDRSEPFVPIVVKPRFQEVRAVAGKYILPVEITNEGRQTVRDVKIEARLRSADSSAGATDVVLDFLGEGSSQSAYFYFEKRPTSSNTQIQPASYRVD